MPIQHENMPLEKKPSDANRIVYEDNNNDKKKAFGSRCLLLYWLVDTRANSIHMVGGACTGIMS